MRKLSSLLLSFPLAAGTSPIALDEAQAEHAKMSAEMGAFYKSQFAPFAAGATSPGDANVPGAESKESVASQQSKIASEMGKFYASQFAPFGVVAQIEKQQAAPQVLLATSPPEKSEVPPKAASACQVAEECKTLDELQTWYDARLDTIKKYVPKDYSHFAKSSLNSDYKKNKLRIEQGSEVTSTGQPEDFPVAFASLMDTLKERSQTQPASDDFPSDVQNSFDSIVDRIRNGINSAADKVKQKSSDSAEKADEIADNMKQRAAEVAQRIKEEKAKEGTQKQKPSNDNLLESPIAATPSSRSWVFSSLTLLLPLGLVASLGALLARHRRQEVTACPPNDDDLLTVYHMQP
jgi:ElaB/YqjD/DUF883 family membrane-anchored ribosome-binding protein